MQKSGQSGVIRAELFEFNFHLKISFLLDPIIRIALERRSGNLRVEFFQVGKKARGLMRVGEALKLPFPFSFPGNMCVCLLDLYIHARINAYVCW